MDEKKDDHEEDVVIRNTPGSSAGVGSGDFHLYRTLRRKEELRLARLREEKIMREEEEARLKKKEERLLEHKLKTEKNQQKRKKRKEKKKALRSSKKMKTQDDDSPEQQNKSSKGNLDEKEMKTGEKNTETKEEVKVDKAEEN